MDPLLFAIAGAGAIAMGAAGIGFVAWTVKSLWPTSDTRPTDLPERMPKGKDLSQENVAQQEAAHTNTVEREAEPAEPRPQPPGQAPRREMPAGGIRPSLAMEEEGTRAQSTAAGGFAALLGTPRSQTGDTGKAAASQER